MSIIAWDGTSIAADKQATVAGMRCTATKIMRLDSGEVLAWAGDQDCGRALVLWYSQGADPAKWPTFQADKDLWVRLVVWRPGIELVTFERQPVAWAVEDKFIAWGGGRDFAMGAMAMGATARQAVEVACRFEVGCGMGIDEISA